MMPTYLVSTHVALSACLSLGLSITCKSIKPSDSGYRNRLYICTLGPSHSEKSKHKMWAPTWASMQERSMLRVVLTQQRQCWCRFFSLASPLAQSQTSKKTFFDKPGGRHRTPLQTQTCKIWISKLGESTAPVDLWWCSANYYVITGQSVIKTELYKIWTVIS